MAATNFFHKIDEAVKRPGRLDVHLFMDNPKREEGIELLKRLFQRDEAHVKPLEDVTITKIYDSLQTEIQNNPEKRRQWRADMFGQVDGFSLSEIAQQQEAQWKNVRPSGADIKAKYEALKGAACSQRCLTEEAPLPRLLIQ